MAIAREQVVQTAEKLVSRGKIEAAIREYRKVLAESPNDANTLNRVGDLYARIQRFDEAVDFFNQIAAQYTQQGFFVKAIAIYKKIIKLNPTHLEVYERLAELYHKQGLVNEARTQYQVLADYYTKHENPTSAIAMYQKMAEVEPENPTYHVKLAELYHQQKLTEKALAEYRTIAELMLAADHPQEAEQVYERALDVDATNIPFITDAVLKLRESGHGALAARFLAAAVERNPQAERVARLVGSEEEPAAPALERTATATRVPVPEPEPAPEPYAAHAANPAFAAEPEPAPEVPDWSAAGLGIPSELFDSQPIAFDSQPIAFESQPIALPGPARPPEPAPAAPAAEPEEFDLDLDEVFVLDMEEEEEPASLVKPPPDMLGEAPRRPAWAQAEDEPAAAAAAPATEPEAYAGSAEDFELPGIEIELEEEAPAYPAVELEAATPSAGSADEEFDLELTPLSSGLELDELPPLPSFETAAEPEPAAAGLDLGGESGELDLEPLPDLEPLAALPELAEEPPAAAPSFHIDHDFLERTAAELHPESIHPREDDLVAEAEVLAKYGLEEKAQDRLREALKVNPRHLPAHAMLIQLHLDKGRHARVLELANQMARAAGGANREPWLKVRRKLISAGYRLDGDQVLAVPSAGEPTPAAPAAPAAAPAAPAPTPSPSPSKAKRGVEDLLRGLLAETPKTPTARPPARPAPPPPVAAAPSPAPPAPPVAAANPRPPMPPISPMPPTPAPAASQAPPPVPLTPMPPPPPPGQTFNLLEIGQMVENEDLDGLDFPAVGSPNAITVPPAFLPPPPPPIAPASAKGLDDTGMSWLDEAEAGRGKKSGGRLFDDEDDFFDLAGELEQELSREEGLRGSDLLVQPAEQSLEQIVEGFKKGVAENLSPTDFDTHFNLGIAYREMGLLDEAIGEFQLASKSPHLLVSCCSMLGLCFLDKGLPELAIKWYRRGLEAPGISEDDSLGLLYDMGNVYDTLGDTDAAYQTFVEIYGINTNYRDVVARIEELGRGR